MRILVISHAAVIPPYREKWSLLTRRHPDTSITIVTPRGWTEGCQFRESQPLESDRFVVCPLSVRFQGKQFIHHYIDLEATMRIAQPDLIHLDEEPSSLVARQVCVARNRVHPSVPLVFMTWENINQQHSFFSRRRHLHKACEKVVYRTATRAIAGSEPARTVLLQRGFCKPIDVFSTLCVDTNRFRPRNTDNARKSLGLPPPIVGYVGRLIPEKGVHLLLMATAAHREKWSVLVVGDGPDRERLLSFAKEAGIANRLRIDTQISIPECPEWMNAMDVLVLPSMTTPLWKEQFGRVLVEAMASGVPVIGSSSGSIPNVMGDAGLIFREGDADHLAQQLHKLLNDPQLASHLRERGLRRASTLFSNEATSDRLLDTYRSVLQQVELQKLTAVARRPARRASARDREPRGQI